jgi:predicted AlkP superfamily phosphohydrolase/phosphomutase
MVALDGLDRSVLDRAFALGRLPNLKAFAEAATELRVRSDGERLEGTVWPTFTTGTGPGEHGHHWFFQWMPEESAFVPATDPRLATTPFWREAVEAGRRVTVFDLPYALPIGHPNERVYTGWGLQDEMDQYVHPPAFKKEIRGRHGRSKVEKDTLLVRTPEDRLKLARKLRAGARQRSQVLLDLVERRDWDVLILGFGEYHLGGHHLSEPMQLSPKVDNETAMLAILDPIDRAWPEIVRAAGDDCDVMLFAVHGMQPKVSYAEGVQRILDERQGKPPPGPPSEDLLRRARNLLPESVHRAVWLRMPASFRLQRMMNAWQARMDVEHDKLFVLEGDCAVALRVNLQGREKLGVVPGGETQAALADLWAELGRYSTESGERPFVDMVLTSDAYSGARTDLLPDAMLLYNPNVVRTRELTRDDGHVVRLTNPESRNGIHTGQGFCFFRPADDVRPKQDTVDNLDFAPTVLERLGVTPADRLQGTTFL